MSPEKLDSAPNTLQTDAYLSFMPSMPAFRSGIIFFSILTAIFCYQLSSAAISKQS